jgi:Ca-activated chloride channel family protein
MVGLNMQLVNWWVLPALAVVGALIITGVLLYKTRVKTAARRQNTVLVANSSKVRNSTAYQVALRKLWIKVIAFGAALTLIGLVAAFGSSRPVTISAEKPQKHNRDIVLCLDASVSMFDVNIDILQKFDQLADGFKGERVALTIFNATGMQVFPLTDDYTYVKENLAKVVNVFEKNYSDPETAAYLASTLGREEGASLIGDGLYGCSLNFDYQEDETRSRSIILATDNVVNGKELVPLDEATQLAAESNIRVYGVNPGSRGAGIGFVPESSINEMDTAVKSTGGKFFLLSNNAAVSTIVDEISETETSKVEGNPIIVRHDSPALVLSILSALLFLLFGATVFRRKN